MRKRTMWFLGGYAGPWRLFGIWWRQRVFVGVSVIRTGEEWTMSERDKR